MGVAIDREDLIAELQRLEKYGFYVIEEAYELAARMDLTVISDMPGSRAAVGVSKKANEVKCEKRATEIVGGCKKKKKRQE